VLLVVTNNIDKKVTWVDDFLKQILIENLEKYEMRELLAFFLNNKS